MSKSALLSLKETFEEAKQNADAIVNKVPFVNRLALFNFSPREDEALLQPDEPEDLDKTYVPQDDNE